jgi:RNA polymerase sigma factor (TIGR02999 family)
VLAILWAMTDVTSILSQIEQGDPHAADQLLPLVYDELRKLAAVKLAEEKPGQTLQATALVHEAYLRLVNSEQAQQWNSRGHFFGAAAEAMRRILLNRARDRNCQKRGGQLRKIDLDNVEIALQTPDEELLALDEALQRLEADNKVCADLVKLRFFAGLSIRDAAAAMGISRSTADRYWVYARAWLFSSLRLDGQNASE